MWDIARRKILKAMQDQRLSNETLGAKVGYSDTTIQRWFAEPKPGKDSKKSAPPYDVILDIAAILDLDIHSLNADIGEHEMRAAQKIGYAGTDELLLQFEAWKADHTNHCEAVISHQAELHTKEIAIKDTELRHKDEVITQLRTNVDWLKNQTRRLRISLITAALICIAIACVLFFVLAVNLPQIGAGGSILTQ